MKWYWIVCWVWLIGYIVSAIYANWRLHVNVRKGLIGNPDDPVAWVSMMTHMLLFWPFIMPRVIYLWRRERLEKRRYREKVFRLGTISKRRR